ncbi:TadE/TadG family type IV pilus assembly protein [Pusillimonas sp.]|uniref:TadE/TadG family type IV pilus assembly protein n=1 Tax=Pusillimonas sp. TaxID=3040095 RepID=UPI0037CB9B63
MPTLSRHVAPGRQCGASAIEFTLVAIPMLLVGLGAVELSRWFFVKQAISLALLEAGRAGITDHARPATIEQAFEQALLPLFPRTGTQTSLQRLQKTLARRQEATGASAWQIRIVSPDTAVFQDFASSQAAVAGATGLAVIDNNYQAEQHQGYLQQGWLEGRGPISGATIFDANSLVLHLSYMHEPLVPGMRALMGVLATGSHRHAQAALAGGYLPMQQTLRLTMQSHPVAWPRHSSKVVPADDTAPTLPATAHNPSCPGLWCATTNSLPSYLPNAQESPGKTNTPDGPDAFSTAGKASEAGGKPAATPVSGPNENTVPPDYDAVCGTVLCCFEG